MQRVVKPFITFVERFYPDPFVFAITLSGIVFLLCLGLTDAGPMGTVVAWGNGLGQLMTFIGQMAFMLVVSHALAHTDRVRALLTSISRIPNTPSRAYAMVAFVAGVANLLSWALGLVVAGVIARQVAIEGKARGLRLHYPLLVAAGYAGFLLWHAGYSSSAALFVATPGNVLEEQIGRLIPVSETIFTSWNMITAAVGLLVITVIMASMKPKDEDCIEISDGAILDYHRDLKNMDEELGGFGSASVTPSRPLHHDVPEPILSSGGGATVALPGTEETQLTSPGFGTKSVGDRMDQARSLTLLLGGGLAIYLINYFITNGLNLTFEIVNWTLLATGLLLCRSPLHYAKLIGNGAKIVGGVLLQFPLYAGIMGMMAGTGLVGVIAAWFVSFSTVESLPFFTFLSAGILNVFIPSGGGQWAVQGPIFIEAASTLGTEPAKIVMAVAYGDMWTNSIQPFWTIPVLAIAGLHMRQIMGYTFALFFVMFFVYTGGLFLAGLA